MGTMNKVGALAESANEAIDGQDSESLVDSQRSDASSEISTSTSRRGSIQEKVKKSGSLISKLSNSSKLDEQGNMTNLPSTLANAFSSLSALTANFSLGSSSTMNGAQHNSNDTSNASLAIETVSTSTRSGQITETKNDLINRKAGLERKNLISLTKLIVKDLISSSLASGRTIENDCNSAIHLNNYFTLIERVLKHGLKQNLLTNRSSNLWAALDNLPRFLKESTLMSESIRSLAHTKSPDGKIKAWMRLAMMQKKLPEYFNELLAQKDVLLRDIYHDHAFMLNDEAHVFAGLIIGVNVIDCNFFVKDDNFDLMDEVIDLSPYLRTASSFDESIDDEGTNLANANCPDGEQMKNLTKILDQKNYLEEWNKHLESTIGNLNSKIKSLEEHNSQLEMEAKVSEVRIAKLQEKRSETSSPLINDSSSAKQIISGSTLPFPEAIKSMINRNRSATSISDTHTQTNNSANVQQAPKEATGEGQKIISQVVDPLPDDAQNSNSSKELVETSATGTNQTDAGLQAELELSRNKIYAQEEELASLRERVGILETSYRGSLDKIRALERDLDIQTSMNSDKETTIKIYEKDIREKQQQVDSLRTSLADAKKLNSDLSERLTDTSSRLKDRLKSVTQLQSSLDKWKLENKTLAARLQDKQNAFVSLTKDLEKAMEQIKDLKKYNEKINDELRTERECGQSSSVTVEEQNAKINELKEKLNRLEKELSELGPYRDQYANLKKKCQEYEQSLEEVGAQLRESRLEVENLKENSSVFLDSQWMDSKSVKQCALCQQSFSVTRRKHHCRLCGNVFCQTCSDNKMELASSAKPARVCDTCHAFLLAKFVQAASSSTNSTPITN